MHTDDLLVSEPNSFEVEITIEKLKKYKSPANNQLIQAGGNTLHFEIPILTDSIWNKEEMP
jgi:hypothetical protein